MDTPKLRFRGFDQPWKEDIIGSLFSERIERDANGEMLSVSMRNGVIKASDNGKADNSSDDKSHYKVVKINDISYNTMRMWQGACGCSKYDGIVSPAYTVLNPHENVNSAFFAQSFRTFKTLKVFKTFSQGLSSDNWNLKFDTIKLISTLFPENPLEQQLIISFIQDLDRLIDIYNNDVLRLTHAKVALMISMFPQKGEVIPRVRFKGFDEPWRPCKLNSFAKRITRKNTNLESRRPLTISAEHGLIDQTDFFNSVIASDNLTGYYLLKKGEFAYNKSYSNRYPFGAVKRLDNYEIGVISNLYIVFEIKGDVSSDFISQYFETNLWHREVAIRAAEGARNHGLLNIGAEDFLDINIQLPHSLDEQQKIAEFFRNLNRQIECQTQILERLKRVKAACLDQMFV